MNKFSGGSGLMGLMGLIGMRLELSGGNKIGDL